MMATRIRRIGVLTGGGDCPGLNAVIRAIVMRAVGAGIEVVGLTNGWQGLVEAATMPLDLNSVSGIIHRGGTILGTSRTNPYKKPEALEMLKDRKSTRLNSSHSQISYPSFFF